MPLVWISFGLHGLLGIVFGDLCTEMDLVLQTPVGEYVDISFIPTMGEWASIDHGCLHLNIAFAPGS